VQLFHKYSFEKKKYLKKCKSEKSCKEQFCTKELFVNVGEIDYRRMNLENSFENIFTTLWYGNLPCHRVKAVSERVGTPMIKYCEWKGEAIDCDQVSISSTFYMQLLCL
jgi:hypothetical protein